MGYQFIHIEGYARTGSKQSRVDRKTKEAKVRQKWSAAKVAAEAERHPDACPHVREPKPPGVLFGCMPSEAAKQAEDWANDSRDAQGRALRKDGLCLLAGVVSLPAEQEADWPEFRAACLTWLKHEYGDRLKSVVEHTDEEHPHLHFYAVPLPGERFENLHSGRQASAEAIRGGKTKGEQSEAYKAAMRAWQDKFSAEVAASFGLTRIGPARRRLPRDAWLAEQAQARALAAPVKGIRIRADDVKKRTTKSSWLGDEYESSDELAGRLTTLAQDQAKPLAFRADLARRRGESEERTAAAEKAAQEAEERAAAAEKAAEEAEQRAAQRRQELEAMNRLIEQQDKRLEAKTAELHKVDRDIDRLREMRDLEAGLRHR